MRRKSTAVSKWIAALVVGFFIVGMAMTVSAKETMWRMTSTWPPSINLIEADQLFVKYVNELCKGKLQIKFFSGGTLMPAQEVFDAVSKGSIQASGDWPNYWSGKDIAFDTLGSYPMGLTPVDYMVWIYQGGGLAIYQEIYGKYGLMYFPTGVTPSESGIRSNKPVKTAADLKGMKVRMGGKAQGYILKELGAAQVVLSGAEVYQALQKGTVDGAEFSGPSTDWKMGLGEVSKYWIAPGFHQPASVMGVMINKAAWEALDKETQSLVQAASKVAFLEFITKQYWDSIEGTKNFLDKGIQLNKIDTETLDKIEKIVNKYTEETAATSPLFKKAIESQINYRKALSTWRNIEEPFNFGYNPKEYPNIK